MRIKPWLLIIGIATIVIAGAKTLDIKPFDIGGGGIDVVAPDTAQIGTPTAIYMIAKVWGDGGPIAGRIKDLSLHYRLTSETPYQTVMPQPVSLPPNYAAAASPTLQFEAYRFIIPPYLENARGEIEYYIDLTLDGHASRPAGQKAIPLVPKP